jgi:rhodanese-related sulfurtransferase
MQNGDKAVDAVDVEETWQLLAARLGSQLIDVRTRAEWAYVGIPDLGPLGKRAILVEWQTFPNQTVDPRFAERLASELGALGVQLDDDLFFICRSGSPSLRLRRWRPRDTAPVTMLPAVSKDRSTTKGIAAPPTAGRRPVFPGFRDSEQSSCAFHIRDVR